MAGAHYSVRTPPKRRLCYSILTDQPVFRYTREYFVTWKFNNGRVGISRPWLHFPVRWYFHAYLKETDLQVFILLDLYPCFLGLVQLLQHCGYTVVGRVSSGKPNGKTKHLEDVFTCNISRACVHCPFRK